MHLGFPSRISGSELALAVGKDGREMLRFEACARKPRHPISFGFRNSKTRSDPGGGHRRIQPSLPGADKDRRLAS